MLDTHTLIQNSIAFRSGEWRPLREVCWSLNDSGPMHGAILVERLRTFRGIPFQTSRHAIRFLEGAAALGIPCHPNKGESDFVGIVETLLEKNANVLEQLGEVGVVILLSPGEQSWEGSTSGTPTLLAHLVPIPWTRLDTWYRRGCDLGVSEVCNVPAACWSPTIKSRSRLQYYLADRKLAAKSPQSIALLLNMNGNVTETSVSNLIVIDRKKKLWSPPPTDILQGVSLETVSRLASDRGYEVACKDIEVQELLEAEEVLMVGTTGCLWSAVSLDGKSIGSGNPGPICRELTDSWIQMVGIDFVEQARERTASAMG